MRWAKAGKVGIAAVCLAATAACGSAQQAANVNEETSVSQPTRDTVKIVSAGEADLKLFSSFSEVEYDAPVLVEVKRIGNRTQSTSKGNDGTVIDAWQVTEVKVEQVHKGEIKPGSILKVAEPGYFDGNGDYVTYEGYKQMEDGHRYLLALRSGSKGQYIVAGLFQGKFDLDRAEAEIKTVPGEMDRKRFEEVDYVGENAEQFNKLKQEALAKYAD
ncbi:hypothetical protein CDO73_10640 [Saccharibacillus sp. O23]|uniref:hypothetical protein n=1 Tax=Saccharibacillus sp. O23 TaxID=2009338 RepID=UPI000B4E6DCC|nr:hypothetical protein [Saccharibacillus sp. O23]OWR30374.1 hypothetical protein CDO73_10640 [Saccharibacillus sp. O23]